MSGPVEFLRHHPFLAEMSEEHLERLAACRATLLTFDPGYCIFREGQDATACYLIDAGDIALGVFAAGNGPRTLLTLHGGDVLGWSWLFPPYRWAFDARTITAVRAVSLDGDRLRGRAEDDHEFGYELMRRFAGVVVDRLQTTRLQLLDLYAKQHRI